MSWPFLYLADDRLSGAELTSARLDGDLVEIGEGYMPADAVETRELRAASLRPVVPPALAVVGESAAWVHGAISEPPARHTVQRRASGRLHTLADARLVYRDHPLPAGADECIAGVWISTPAHTLADLVRAAQAGDDVGASVDALLAWRPGLATAAITVLEHGRAVHFKRAALAYLRGCVARGRTEIVAGSVTEGVTTR